MERSDGTICSDRHPNKTNVTVEAGFKPAWGRVVNPAPLGLAPSPVPDGRPPTNGQPSLYGRFANLPGWRCASPPPAQPRSDPDVEHPRSARFLLEFSHGLWTAHMRGTAIPKLFSEMSICADTRNPMRIRFAKPWQSLDFPLPQESWHAANYGERSGS